MVLSIHQPNYWPSPALLGKIMMSDKFVYLTRVQYEIQSWQSRNRIRTRDGFMYITVPTAGSFDQLICDVEISSLNANWKRKHLGAIEHNYNKTPHFGRYKEKLREIYSRNWSKLMDIDIFIMNFLIEELHIETKVFIDSDLSASGLKTGRLVNICKELECDTYISNLGSKAYIKVDEFVREGIDHIYINYEGKPYKQRYEGFESNLSVLDLLMNCGPDAARAMIEDRENYYIGGINEAL